MTLRWADGLNEQNKNMLLELFPWKVFLFLHRNILLTTFLGKPLYYFDIFEDGVHIISLTFRVFAIVWLFVLVVYVGYGVIMPHKSETPIESDKAEMVTGIVSPCTLKYPSKSVLVVGLETWLLLFGRKPVDLTSDTRAEQKGNALLHKHFSVLFRELD